MNNIANRIGKVEISRSILQENTGIFSKMNPIHIENEKYEIYTFTCVSEYFDKVDQGGRIPFYDIQITQNGNHLDFDFIKTDR